MGWTLAIICGASSVFTVSVFFQSYYTYNPLYAATYSALHRIAWAASTGWLLIVCSTKNGGYYLLFHITSFRLHPYQVLIKPSILKHNYYVNVCYFTKILEGNVLMLIYIFRTTGKNIFVEASNSIGKVDILCVFSKWTC